jgi:hypothetical protein
MVKIFAALCAVLALCAQVQAWDHGSAASNTNSPLGVNLNQAGCSTPELPLANVWKLNCGWTTVNSGGSDTGEEDLLCVDTFGNPIDLSHKLSTVGGNPNTQCTAAPTFVAVIAQANFAVASPYYPSGTYDVYYTGTCSLAYSGDGTGTFTNTGHDTVTVASPSGQGIVVKFSTTNSSTPCEITSLTHSSLTTNYLANCSAGYGSKYCYNPHLLSYLANFRALRFMDWMNTNGVTALGGGSTVTNPQTTWATRPVVGNVSYNNFTGSPAPVGGVPMEILVDLANQGNWDLWIDMPIQATNGSGGYVQNAAQYALSNLNSTSQVYVEYYNEPWNSATPGYATIQTLANAQFGNTSCPLASQPFNCNMSYVGMKVALMCQDWSTIWGTTPFANRIHCIMSGQAANNAYAAGGFQCTLWSGAPCGTYGAGGSSSYGITAVDIAPYMGCDAGASSANPTNYPLWYNDGDGGYTNLFLAFTTGGSTPWDDGGAASYGCMPAGQVSFLAVAQGYLSAHTGTSDFPTYEIVGYESGQQLSNFQWSNWTSLFTGANENSQMGSVYASYYANWKSGGGRMLMVFSDIGAYNSGGSYGQEQTICGDGGGCSYTSAPTYNLPKYTEDLSFIAANPCTGYSGWTKGCH